MNTTITLGRNRTAPVSGIVETDTDPATAADPAVPSSRVPEVALVLWPALLAVFAGVDDAGLAREEPATYLASIADDPDRFLLATVAYFFMAAMIVPAAIALRRLLGRGRTGRIGAALIGMAGVSATAFSGAKFVFHGLVSGPDGVTPDLVAAFERFQGEIGFVLLADPLFIGLILGSILTSVAMWRTRTVPRWVPVLFLAGLLAGGGEVSLAVSVAGNLAATVAAVGAVRALRQQAAA